VTTGIRCHGDSLRPESWLAAATLAVLGCSESPTPTPVCDGSDELVLRVQSIVSAEALEPGEPVLYDNGAGYLFVNGACEYYVEWTGPFGDARAGVLSPDQELALLEGLGAAQVAASPGEYAGDVFDGSTFRLQVGADVVTCTGGCQGGDVPAWLASARAFSSEQLSQLADDADSPDLPQRVVVVEHTAGPLDPLFSWPAPDLDPATIAVDDRSPSATSFGGGVLVDGASGAALRDLRRTLAALPYPPTGAYVWHTRDAQPPEYSVYIRDAIPWEDARGLVP
jgi:hypothetical protein